MSGDQFQCRSQVLEMTSLLAEEGSLQSLLSLAEAHPDGIIGACRRQVEDKLVAVQCRIATLQSQGVEL